MSLKRRITKNTLANFTSLGLNATLQLAQVPILTAIWPIEKYGVWLLLSTIPTYFALTDLGFSAAAQTAMTMKFAKGEHTEVKGIYQSTWTLMLFLSLAALIALTPLLFCPSLIDHTTGFAVAEQYGVTIFLFAIYSATGLCSRVVLAGFRASNLYFYGSMLYEAGVFAEGCAILAVAACGGSFAACVSSGIGIRIAVTLLCDTALRRKVDGLQLGFSEASVSCIKTLTKPALSAMATPISLAMNIQGIALVVGATISPLAVATLTPVRTASRLVLQIVSAFNRGTMPELSRAASILDHNSLRKLLKANTMAVLIVLIPGTILFVIAGRLLITAWTHGHVRPSTLFIEIMAAAMLTQGAWYLLSNILLASNEHSKTGIPLLLISMLTIALAIPAGKLGGLPSVATTILTGELLSLATVYTVFRGSNLYEVATSTTNKTQTNPRSQT